MRRCLVKRDPCGEPSSPRLLVVWVLLEALLLAVSNLPTDVTLHTVEVILRLYGNVAARNWRCAPTLCNEVSEHITHR